MHTHAFVAPSGLSDGAPDAIYGAGVDPVRAPPSQRGRAPRCRGTQDYRTATCSRRHGVGCRGCAGTTGRTSCRTPAAANVSLLCGLVSVSPHTAQGTCPACACLQKDHLRTPGCGLPEVLRPTESPDMQRSRLATTKEWRPGRRRATWLPRRIGRPSVRERAVCGCVRPQLREGAAPRRCVTPLPGGATRPGHRPLVRNAWEIGHSPYKRCCSEQRVGDTTSVATAKAPLLPWNRVAQRRLQPSRACKMDSHLIFI